MEEKKVDDPRSICYVQSNTIKRLSVISPTFLKLFLQQNVFLPHECFGTLLDIKKPSQPLFAVPTPIKNKSKQPSAQPYFGDPKVFEDVLRWFDAIQLCYQQKRQHTLQIPILILHGNTGCGKTFLLQTLASKCGVQLESVSLSGDPIANLHNSISRRNLAIEKPIIYLQDVILFPKTWMNVLHESYQKGQLNVPIVIEITTSEYYESRYKTTVGHTQSLYSFWKLDTFVKSVRMNVKPQFIRHYINWLRNVPDHDSTLFDSLVFAAEEDYRRARELLASGNTILSSSVNKSILPSFRTLFDVGTWLFREFETKQSLSPFLISEGLHVYGDSLSPSIDQLCNFFRKWIVSSQTQPSSSPQTIESSPLTSWAKTKRESLIKTESSLRHMAKRKKLCQQKFTLEELQCQDLTISLRGNEHCYLHSIQNVGMQRWKANNELNQKEKEKPENREHKNTDQSNHTTKQTLRELNALCSLSDEQSLNDTFTMWDHDSDSTLYDSMIRNNVINTAKHIAPLLSRKNLAYKDIMSWFMKR